MTIRHLAPLALILAFAACSGNSLNNGTPTDPGGGGGTGIVVPAAVKGRMISATYEPGDETIVINMNSQDVPDAGGVYRRDTDYDLEEYYGYSSQETTSNRVTVALVRRVGTLRAGVALNGQFADYYGGGTFARDGEFSKPVPTGTVGSPANYSGAYTGLLNTGPSVPGPGGALDPIQPLQTTGRTLVTADFDRMELSGGIDQRRIVGIVGEGGALVPALLRTGTINTDGTFSGVVTLQTDNGLQDSGTYAGLFGGTGSTEIAALLVFNPYPTDSAIFEHGVFVLPSCTSAGGPACPAGTP